MSQVGSFMGHHAFILRLQACQHLLCLITVRKQALNWSPIKAYMIYKLSLASCRRKIAISKNEILLENFDILQNHLFRNYGSGNYTWYLNWISNNGSIAGPGSGLSASDMMNTLNVSGTPPNTTCLGYQLPQANANFINCTVMSPICMKVQSGRPDSLYFLTSIYNLLYSISGMFNCSRTGRQCNADVRSSTNDHLLVSRVVSWKPIRWFHLCSNMDDGVPLFAVR